MNWPWILNGMHISTNAPSIRSLSSVSTTFVTRKDGLHSYSSELISTSISSASNSPLTLAILPYGIFPFIHLPQSRSTRQIPDAVADANMPAASSPLLLFQATLWIPTCGGHALELFFPISFCLVPLFAAVLVGLSWVC